MPFDVYKCFMPECYLDTNLLEVLLNKPNAVNHKKGNSSIVKEMDDFFKDRFAVGLIDDDKVKVKALETYIKISRLWKTTLKLFKHPERKHFIIQVSPAIEKWILSECKKER